MLFRAGTWTVRDRLRGRRHASAWTAAYGVTTGDQPVLGDWDGDGADDLGVYRGDVWHLRSTGTARPAPPSPRFALRLAAAATCPVAATGTATATTTPGIFRAGTWYLRSTAGATGGTTAHVHRSAPPATSRSSGTLAPTRPARASAPSGRG